MDFFVHCGPNPSQLCPPRLWVIAWVIVAFLHTFPLTYACFGVSCECQMAQHPITTTFLLYLRPHRGCWGIQQAVIQISAELFNQRRPSVSIRSTPGSAQTVPVLTAAHHLPLIQDHMRNTDSQASVYQVKLTLLPLGEFPHASTMACSAEFFTRLASTENSRIVLGILKRVVSWFQHTFWHSENGKKAW